MNKKKIFIISTIIIIVITAVVLLFRQGGKVNNFSIDPADAGLYYEMRAMHEEWGKLTLEIEKGGASTLKRYQELELKETIPFDVSQEELAQILNVAEQEEFFSFQEVYEDPMIMDGSITVITIFYGNESKTVKVINDYNEGFSAVESEIAKLINEKTGSDPYNFNDL